MLSECISVQSRRPPMLVGHTHSVDSRGKDLFWCRAASVNGKGVRPHSREFLCSERGVWSLTPRADVRRSRVRGAETACSRGEGPILWGAEPSRHDRTMKSRRRRPASWICVVWKLDALAASSLCFCVVCACGGPAWLDREVIVGTWAPVLQAAPGDRVRRPSCWARPHPFSPSLLTSPQAAPGLDT